MHNNYFSLLISENEKEAHVYIFGDIVSWEWFESDVSSYTLSKALAELDVDHIICHINSYGGEVAEGLAIYNTLKNHKAKVTTICDGFACSAASTVFMAGGNRIMNSASLLMIHNAWTVEWGDANTFRKTADDLDKITDESANAYRDAGVTLSDEKLKAMLDAETWITPEEAYEWGFATVIQKPQTTDKVAACARQSAYKLITAGRKTEPVEEPPPQESEPQEPAVDKSAVFLRAAINYLNN